MRKTFRALFLILVLASVSSAQNFTLQGGNFQLAGGAGPVANGSVILTLSNPAATIIATGAPCTAVYTINLDANGNMPLTQVIGNSACTPPGTFYTAQLFSAANGGGTLISTQTWIVGPSAPYSGTLYPNVMVLPAVSFAGAVTVPSSTITFSATPTFNAGAVSKFYITLTGNVTSSTLTGAVKDQLVIFAISQDGVGGRTFAWPTNVKGNAIASGAGLTSTQAFTSDGTNLWPIGGMTVSSGTTDERLAHVMADGSQANPGLSYASEPTSGWFWQQAGIQGLARQGNYLLQISGSTFNFVSSALLAFSGGAPNAVAADTGFSRIAAGTVGVGNGTAGNASGTIQLSTVKQGSATGSFAIIDNLGISHVFISGTSPYVNLFLSGNGAGAVFLGSAGKTSVDDVTGNITLSGSTSGTSIVKASAAAGATTLTLPAATDQLVARATTDTLTNKTLTSPVIGTTTISEAPRMVLVSGFQSGNLAAGILGSAFQSKGITVEAITVHSTSSSTCTVNPSIRVRNGGSTVITPTLTLTTGTSDWNTTGNAVNYSASDTLFIEVTSAGTCTTPPSNLMVNVTGRMQ